MIRPPLASPAARRHPLPVPEESPPAVFTGLVTAVGEVRRVSPLGGGRDMRVEVATPPGWLAGVSLGASICCSGCCLTAVEAGEGGFAVEVSAETLARTTLGGWSPGRRVNLERSLRLGDELGGHLVSGHVDAVGEVLSITPENASRRWVIGLPPALARLVAVKGSVAVDGVSLTVNEAGRDRFGVNLIPHTAEVTALGDLAPGSRVNLEADLVARYVARLTETRA